MYSNKSCDIRANFCIPANMAVIGQKLLYLSKVLWFCQNGCIRARCFGSGKVLYSDKSGWILAKWLYYGKNVVFEHVVLFGQKKLYSGKSGCNRAKWLYLGKSYSILAKWLYLGKSGRVRSKFVVFRQKRFYSCKRECVLENVVVFRQKGLY